MSVNTNPRYMRKAIILAKLETIYGTDAVCTGADALLVSDMDVSYTSNNKNRDVIRPWLGASEELVGDDYMTFSFTVEMAPSGTPGVAPPWGKLLRACAMAQAITAATKVTYTPVSQVFESLTLKYVLDGMQYTATGARGTADFSLALGDAPKIKFTFTAMYAGAISASAVVATSMPEWKLPQRIGNFSGSNFWVYTPDTPAPGDQSTDETYSCRGMNLALGNAVSYQPMLGQDRVIISDRSVTGSITFDLDAAEEIEWRAAVRSNTLRAIRFRNGTATGKNMEIVCNSAQFLNPKTVNQDGIAMTSFDIRCIPQLGNDEFMLTLA